MVDLIALEKDFLSAHILAGDTVADFTMGNGHDTLWLSRAVGENGRVFAFDVQEAALENTARLLEEENAPHNYCLILDSHSNLKKYIECPIKAGVFNLGWLPGSDRKVTTLRETTAKAVTDAVEILAHDGIILIAVYPGHDEGTAEGDMLAEMLSRYDRRSICASRFCILNSPTSPFFYLIEKK